MCEPDTERVKKLFVVGNGFDLHHGLSTRFEDFRWYLEEQRAGYDDQVDLVETYLCDLRGNWSNLEEALASLDIDSLRERAQDFLMPYSADDWSDAYNHDYQYEMGEVLEALSRRLVEAIAEWIGGVPIPNPGHLPLLLRVEPD
ncbi:MAG: AbiH family protein, partial [Rhodothermales bacterium]